MERPRVGEPASMPWRVLEGGASAATMGGGGVSHHRGERARGSGGEAEAAASTLAREGPGLPNEAVTAPPALHRGAQTEPPMQRECSS